MAWAVGLRAGLPKYPSSIFEKCNILSHAVHTGSGQHNVLCNGKRESFFPPGVKHREDKPDHSHPPSAELKNECRYISVPPYNLMERKLIKHRETLY